MNWGIPRASLPLVTLVVCLSGCATILGGGPNESVRFESEPSDATVMIDGVERGRTPVSVELKRKDSHVVKMRKECYTHDKLYVTRTMRTGWAVADYIFLVPTLYISVGVDYLTGAWYTFDKDRVTVKLTNTCEGSAGEGPDKSGERTATGDCPEGAEERCDGKDNDCDGTIDEQCD